MTTGQWYEFRADRVNPLAIPLANERPMTLTFDAFEISDRVWSRRKRHVPDLPQASEACAQCPPEDLQL
ncbi:MAG: hypothetical protein ABIQ73_04240 [Acidimicrobiales bacterium]